MLDVFLIGPLMIYGGVAPGPMPKPVRVGLLFFGTSTIVYNGANFWIEKGKNDDTG